MTKPRRAPPAADTRRCAIYTRKSTSAGLEQDFNSLDSQYESCLAYIQRQQGWQLIRERYDDGGFTGANTDRPAFQRLMADVDAGKIDVIVVYKVDRLSRSLLDFVKVMERLGTAGASFVSVTQNFSTADPMGRLTMNLLASFAEFEREIISQRTRDKIAGSRRRGKWTGGPTPFGYRLENKKLVVNEVEARTVREAFRLFLEHRQAARVARLLNATGLLPRGCPSRPAKHGLRWRKEALARLLRSPVYVGQVPYGSEVHPGEHPPLVDAATFETAQSILGGKQGHSREAAKNPDYVLRGIVRCQRCGGALCPGSTRKGRKTYRYYRCSTRDRHGSSACDAAPISAEGLEQFVVERIAECAARRGFVARVERMLDSRAMDRQAELERVRRELPGLVAEASARAAKLTEQALRLKGRARELVEAQLAVEGERLTAAERQLEETETALAKFEESRVEAGTVVTALRDFDRVWPLLTVENQGRLLRTLVTEVRVDAGANLIELELLNAAELLSDAEAA
jgi:DNA invertase Pin-like site-specific DNA recombinase